jgi:lipopolysaccharide export system permease protein
MLANLLPEYLSLGIPIGLMLGVLLAFRKLALSSELDALRGIGVSFGRLLRVPYFYAVPLLALNLFIVGYLEPWSHYRYEGLRFDLKSGALGAAIKVGEFNNLGRRLTLRIDRSENNGTQLHGIFVQMDDKNGMSVAATAERGRFLATDDPDTILFRLIKGRLVQESPKFPAPRTLSFETYDLPVSLPVIDQFRRRGGTQSEELYLHELFAIGYLGGTSDLHQKLEARAHLNFRLVEVMMMLLLPLLAVALAVPPKRSSSSLGIFLSIVIVVAYHKVNQYAEQMASQGRVDAIVGLWVPFLLLGVMIVWMYHVLAHKPGGQPIGALEFAASKSWRFIRGVLPRRGRPNPA